MWPIFGGLLIGLSATLLLLFIGRIAGICGILWGAVSNKVSAENSWRWLFIVGIVLGAFLFHQITGAPVPKANSNYMLAIIAGLLVGVGVQMANGCTSGHGVCGLGRLSLRSLVATLTFMLTAVITVALFKLFIGS